MDLQADLRSFVSAFSSTVTITYILGNCSSLLHFSLHPVLNEACSGHGNLVILQRVLDSGSRGTLPDTLSSPCIVNLIDVGSTYMEVPLHFIASSFI